MTALAEKQHLVSKIGAAKSGESVTLTLTVPGTYDPTTNTFSGSSVTTMTGWATRVPGDPKRYQALELVESENPTIAFTPDTFGDTPSLHMTLSLGGVTFSVRDVAPWTSGGATVSVRLIVSR